MFQKLLSYIKKSIKELESDNKTLSHPIIPKILKEEDRQEHNRMYVDIPEKVIPIFGFTKAHIVQENEKIEYFPIPPEHYERAITDIMSVNEFLNQAHDLDSSLRPSHFTPSDVLFKDYAVKVKHSDIPNYTYDLVQNASMIEEKVFTPQGNISKFPFILNFRTIPKPAALRNSQYTYDIKDEVFGKILYDQKGLPGRIEIVNWNRSHCHQVIITTTNSELSISTIFSTDGQGRKFKKYDRAK